MSLTRINMNAYIHIHIHISTHPHIHTSTSKLSSTRSRKAKAFRALLDGHHEVRAQLFVGLKLRQVQLVEAGVGLRQATRAAAVFLDVELLRPAHAHQLGKAAHWDLARAGDKLHELDALLAVKGAHGPPKPDNLRAARAVARAVLGVGLQVVHVHVRQAGDDHLQLLLVEDGNLLLRNQLVEAVLEGLDLLLDHLCQLGVRHQVHILLLRLVGHVDIPPVRLEVHRLQLAEAVHVDGERVVLLGDLVLQDPQQALVQRLVHRLHVAPGHGDAENLLVKGPREMAVQVHAVVDSLGHHSPTELKVVEVRRVHVRVRVWLVRLRADVRLLEERIVGVHHRLGQLVVPLPRQPARVDAVLPFKLHVHPPAQILARQPLQLVVRVLKDVVPPHLQPLPDVPLPVVALAQGLPEKLLLHPEVQHMRNLQQQRKRLHLQHARILPHQRVDHRPVPLNKLQPKQLPRRQLLLLAAILALTLTLALALALALSFCCGPGRQHAVQLVHTVPAAACRCRCSRRGRPPPDLDVAVAQEEALHRRAEQPERLVVHMRLLQQQQAVAQLAPHIRQIQLQQRCVLALSCRCGGSRGSVFSRGCCGCGCCCGCCCGCGCCGCGSVCAATGVHGHRRSCCAAVHACGCSRRVHGLRNRTGQLGE
eukprot:m.136846 g.136846  ORF g.136846 m.136846 type:complete len:650 (+) comp16591_c0_seq3:562-2511(+)